jgi:hypothetical protein
MDTTSEVVAFILVIVAVGGAIWSLMFAINGWLAGRRAAQADRLVAADGVLREIGARHVTMAKPAQSAS